jgi:chorismate--pyruvate lyase
MSRGRRLTWRARPQRNKSNAAYLPWLSDRGSLTERLQARGTFSVQLLQHGLVKPTEDEAGLLRIRPHRLAWIREVALFCDGMPLVFAHTALAYQPRGPLTHWLAGLGNRSLGALLFSHPGFARGPLKCIRLDARHALYRRAIVALQLGDAPPRTLWARRSRFSFGAQSVLVTEVFSSLLQTGRAIGKPRPDGQKSRE